MLNPEMVIFNDFSTYRRRPSWRKNTSKAESLIITNTHDPQQLQYEFLPVTGDMKWRGDEWKQEVEDLLKDQAWEITKDIVGAGLIALGTWLANPVGPEDWVFGSPFNPIDEIIGVGLIWTGRFIMWA